MKFLLPLISILFFISCSKGEKNDFDKNIKFAYDYGIDPLMGDTVYRFMLPNGFSPNGDGNNDYFFAQGIGIKRNNFSMKIFGRNGNVLFITNDLYKYWDGRVNGGTNFPSTDLYNVDISLTDTLGNSHRYLNYIQIFK